MITEEQARELKEIIGTNYSTKISSYLRSKDIKNTQGVPCTAHYIRNVVNSFTYNEELEVFIFDATAYYKRKHKRENKRRENMLKSV